MYNPIILLHIKCNIPKYLDFFEGENAVFEVEGLGDASLALDFVGVEFPWEYINVHLILQMCY